MSHKFGLSAALALFLFVLPASGFSQQTAAENPLYDFNPGGASNLIKASDGNYYGTQNSGYNAGNIFQITPQGAFKVIYALNAGTDGQNPNNIIEGSDGELYGTTTVGGNGQENLCGSGFTCGTIFKVSTAGKFTLLHSFSGGADGYNPTGGLVQGSDGYYYGTANYGGGPADDCAGSYQGGCGTVFRISSTGDFKVIYTFLVDGTTGSGAGGGYPHGNMVQGSNGNFYGTASLFNYDTQEGMVLASYQTIFSVSPDGSEATVYTSTNSGDSDPTQPSDPDGLQGFNQLTEGSDGNLYGSAVQGGSNTGSSGTLFKMTLDGDLTMLDEFPVTATGTATRPYGSLALGGDGNFYGTASSGGLHNCGTAFSMTPAGTLTDLYDFQGSDGCTPNQLVPGSVAGYFYGTTSGGGFGYGVAYDLVVSPNAPPPVQLTLTQPTITIGGATTLNWQVLNAFSTTMQQCNLFVTQNGTSYPEGKLTGTLSNNIFAGSVPLTPPVPGIYALAITCGGQESGFATLTVNRLTSTNTLIAAPNPVRVGQSVTLTATVAKVSGFASPTGSVTFYFGSIALGTATVNAAGVANLTASSDGQPVGNYALYAAYSGDALYNPLDSPSVNVILSKAAATSTTIMATPNPVTRPATETLTATVQRTSGSGTPTGSVTFNASGETVGKVTLNGSGVATFKASTSGIPAGKYSVTAVYGGDASDAGSTSTAVTVTVK